MSAAPCTKHPQQGFALLEALITLVIAAILGLGLAYALARASAAQRIMNGQNMAVTQMRYQMQIATSTNCNASSTIAIASTTIAATCSYTGSNYTVTANNSAGVSVASGPVTINAPSISTSASDTNGSQYLGGQMTMSP